MGLGHLGYSTGYYGHHGLGYSYIGKREAEAEPKADADPYLLYGGYGLGHLGYSTGLYGHHLGYSHYYANREAEPKADPYLLYGGYGHLGYAGYYGYPYTHHGLAYYGEPEADADPLSSLWWIWIWTPWICRILRIPICSWIWLLRKPIWRICLLRISYDTKAISCYRKLTKLPSMSSSSVTTFFSAWTQFWVVQQETKRIKI